MDQSTHPPTLYARLLGDSWARLDGAVRDLHGNGSITHGTAFMRVSRGTNGLTRLLAAVLRLPAAAEAAPVTLTITPSGAGEEWRRTFAGRPLVTRQWLRSDGLLAEQAGLTELLFRLEVQDGGLVYHPAGAALRLGRLRAPLPRRLAPTVTARESSAETPGRTQVSVRVTLPVLGLLISYEGLMTRSAGEA